VISLKVPMPKAFYHQLTDIGGSFSANFFGWVLSIYSCGSAPP
jgi:hypothetical protein